MTIKELRDYLHAQPFRPIVVRTVGGSRHPVHHPDYLMIPPIGNYFLIVDPDGTMNHIDINHVEAIESKSRSRKS